MPDNLPPMWGGSYWWPRIGYLLGALAIVIGAVMTGGLSKHVGSCALPGGLKAPALAIEIAPPGGTDRNQPSSWRPVLDIVGPCEAPGCRQSVGRNVCISGTTQCTIVCPDKAGALAWQQGLDRVFIVLYWLLFVYFAVVNILFGGFAVEPGARPWRVAFARVSRLVAQLGGIAVVPAVTYGAIRDWLEDDKILQALAAVMNGAVVAGPVPDMRGDAYQKWLALFIAMGCSTPIFIFWPGRANNAGEAGRRSLLSTALAWITAVLGLSAAFTGIQACRYGQDQRLETAAGSLFLCLPAAVLTLVTAQYWRGGTMGALNKLASLPVLRRIARTFEDPEPLPPAPAGPAGKEPPAPAGPALA